MTGFRIVSSGRPPARSRSDLPISLKRSLVPCSVERVLVGVQLVEVHDVRVLVIRVQDVEEGAGLRVGVVDGRLERLDELVALAGLGGDLGEDGDLAAGCFTHDRGP